MDNKKLRTTKNTTKIRMENKIIFGDCIEEMKKLPDCSVDAIITDPPYDLTSINKRFSKENSAPAQYGKDGSFSRLSKGFMGKTWDGTRIAFKKETWKECYRIIKAGGHLISFGGTRTYHKMATAIEEAGFEIRDMIAWVYGSGFPKSLNIGKAVDKLRGNEREVVGYDTNTAPDLRDAFEWEGWGTALKPSHEPIVLARKPLSKKTIVENILKYGTGGINIDESRIPCDIITDQIQNRTMIQRADGKEKGWGMKPQGKVQVVDLEKGRFPANLIHDGSPEVMKEFPDVEEDILSDFSTQKTLLGNIIEKNIINSSRFFYCAKASKEERNKGLEKIEVKKENLQGLDTRGRTIIREDGSKTLVERWKGTPTQNNHPTVKPVSLMKYLIKLITPPKGIVLDPFMGSGTTGVACAELGFNFIGIEKEEEYIKIAQERIKHYNQQQKITKYDKEQE